MNKVRLTIKDSPEIGKLRYETYKGVLSKYNKALEVGCYLEAITLMESIIFDRLTSIVNETQEEPITRETFKRIIDRCKNLEFLHPLTDNLDQWRENRNKALHEMAKSLSPEFEQKYNATKEVAEKGLSLFREVDKVISSYRKNK